TRPSEAANSSAISLTVLRDRLLAPDVRARTCLQSLKIARTQWGVGGDHEPCMSRHLFSRRRSDRLLSDTTNSSPCVLSRRSPLMDVPGACLWALFTSSEIAKYTVDSANG